MSNDEARKLVEDGLTLRRKRREAAEREARMEAYEKEMITFCNGHYANAKESRAREAEKSMEMAMEALRKEEARSRYIEQRKREREQAQQEMAREARAYDAVRNFILFCMVTALVTVWTPFPWWAAVALVAGCTALAAAYVFRLYYPMDEKTNS